MKIFTASQISEHDKYTITHEHVASIDLMERAAKAIASAIMARWDRSMNVVVFAGPGNNGGDALAVARLLAESGYAVAAYLFNIRNRLSDECTVNRKRIGDCKKVKSFDEITQNFDPPKLDAATLVVDGLFGSGLNKPLTGGFASLVKYINQSHAQVVSIDLPSGLMTEDNTHNILSNIVQASLTLTLQQKKLCMYLADMQRFLGQVEVLDIGLSGQYVQETDSPYRTVELQDVARLMKPRSDFAHKGSMGSALIVAGSYGMAGAAILATRACLRSGVGKATVHAPKKNYAIMQVAVPEAVVQIDREETCFSEPVDTDEFDAVGIGPGLGRNENTAIALIAQVRRAQCPVVLDADALNILGSHRAWMQQLPAGVVLTPHPREYDRLAGSTCAGDYERLQSARQLAQRHGIYIILKGHHSALCLPDGMVLFNTTGNSGMATGGSGDVLTGVLTALLARGYKQSEACLLGMYLHGLAGDMAESEKGHESLIAGDLIDYLPQAFKALTNCQQLK